MTRLRRWLKRSLIAVMLLAVVGYIGLCVVTYRGQESTFFVPDPLPADFVYTFSQPFEEHRFPAADGVSLHGLLFPAKASRGVILLLFGRVWSLRYAGAPEFFLEHHYDVFELDYRSYGKSGGTISSEAQFMGDVQAAYDWLATRYAQDRIIVVGQSLGTGPAAEVGCRNHPQRVVLLTPPYSMRDLAGRLLPYLPTSLLVKYPMRVDLALQHCGPPVSVFHAAEDEIMPHDTPSRLQKLLKPSDTQAVLAGVGHEDVIVAEGYEQAMSALLDGPDARSEGPGAFALKGQFGFWSLNWLDAVQPSPGGEQVAFIDRAPATYSLAIRRPVTGNTPQPLVRKTEQGWPKSFMWARDSARIAYVWQTAAAAELHVIGVDGRGERTIPVPSRSDLVQLLDWSPDGTTLLVGVLSHGDVHGALVTIADGTLRLLDRLDLGGLLPFHAEFSPDGRAIVYSPASPKGNGKRDIVLLPIDGSAPRTLIGDPADDYFLGWMSDGRHVLFASDRSGTVDVWSMAVANERVVGSPELVKRDVGEIAPIRVTSRDEFYYAAPNRGPDVYEATLDPATGRMTSAPTLIAGSNGRTTATVWFPEGRQDRLLLPDGASVIDASAARSIVIKRLDTGAERTAFDAGASGQVSSLALSSDGTQLAFRLLDTAKKTTVLMTLMLSDSKARQRTALKGATLLSIGRTAWSPDGRFIFYVEESQKAPFGPVDTLWRIPAAGGSPEPVGLSMDSIVDISVHPDGRRLMFTNVRSGAQDIRMLRLPRPPSPIG